MLTRTVRERRRWTRTSPSLTAAPSSCTSTGSSSPAGMPELVRRAAQSVAVGGGGDVAERQRGRARLGRTPAASNGRTTPILSGEHRLAQECSAEVVELALGETVERGDEAGARGHAGVDLVGGEVVLQHDVDGRRRHRRRATAS